VTDRDGNLVQDAEIKVVVTRPNSRKHDKELTEFKLIDGLYEAKELKLDLPGRWDVMAKVQVGDLQRYFNVKADTRKKEYKVY
jgi:nitrogen fixation protein FixH